ncbi:MAG: ATP-binding cassette domain-containing protein [Flavisolibacter sp.]
MKIRLSQAGKRFNREWIFRKADFQFNSSSSYAITGPNGSGKSTMLQCIGGMIQLSEGSIGFDNEFPIASEEIYREISFCAPYSELIEEMTLHEFLEFHRHFKPFLDGMDVKKIVEEIGLATSINKQIRYYSSGMKQRVKLAQAIFFQTSIILLDEPCSNLDSMGIELYHSLIKRFCANRLVIVCSNDPVEYGFCKEIIGMASWK